MEKNRVMLTGFLSFSVIALAGSFMPSISGLSLAERPAKKAPGDKVLSASDLADQLIKKWDSGTSSDLPTYRGRVDALVELQKRWNTLSPKAKENAFNSIYGFIPNHDHGAGRSEPNFSPYLLGIRNPQLIDFLVFIYLKEPSSDFRRQASRILAWRVPEKQLRIYAKPITEKYNEKFKSRYEPLLFGKLGAIQAQTILEKEYKLYSKREIQTSDEYEMKRNIELALAKLGDTKLEQRFINEFEKACKKPPQGTREVVIRTQIYQASRCAQRLGYIAQPGSVMALARQFRNSLRFDPVDLDAPQGLSVRYAVFYALGYVWPDSPLFWLNSNDRVTEKTYPKVEEWLKKYLKVDWKEPAPPFKDEILAPYMLKWR